MSNEYNIKAKLKRPKKKKKIAGYIYLFIFVFITALVGITYVINYFSPDVDVEIGNKSSLVLNDEDIGMEVKPIDERLKWIQEEDELPSVAVRENKHGESINKDSIVDTSKDETENVKEVIPPPNKPKTEEKQELPKQDFRTANNSKTSGVIPAPVPSLIKVYVGSYSSLEEAMAVQQQINSESHDTMSFIKAINGGKYIVQLGSFSTQEKADTYIQKMKAKGYNPKIL